MHTLESLDALAHAGYPKAVLALGNFDGVHRGHQAIFQQVLRRALAITGTSMVLTFNPHPVQILRPDKAPPLLSTRAQKRRLFAALGLAVSLELPFTEHFAQQEPMAFIGDVLHQSIGVHDLVVGHDFRFGHCRAGTTDLLAAQAATFGYQLTVVPPITENGVVVSSSNIRRLLQHGQVEDAARLLGRPYLLEGPVVEGFRRGHTLGFPTANVRSLNPIVPQAGVYAVHVLWHERVYPGVANVGYNPTFGNDMLSVEAHVLDFSGDLYGETLGVEFLARLRDERKFASVAELAAQITRDVHQARALHAQRSGHT